jgi:hypothetical protein
MRDINVWAYSADFGTLCRNAKLDTSTGLSYPSGDTHGQAGWDVAVRFSTLDELAKKLSDGLPMPRQFCGQRFKDCEPIARGEISRLAIMAHGDHGGKVAVNGKDSSTFLTADNVASFHNSLHTIGLYTRDKSTILLTSCIAGQGENGTRLLKALSGVWPGRSVVGFATIGYRHPGAMSRSGDACELPGMRDTDAPDPLFASGPRFDRLWGDFEKMPWASEKSINAKVVLNGVVQRCPPDERCTPATPPIKKPAPQSPRMKPRK